MKILFYATALSFVGSCSTFSHNEKIQQIKDNIIIEQPNEIMVYANTITAKELEKHLYTFASDTFQGRKVGSKGQKLAVNFLKNYYINEDISSPIGETNYFQIIPKSYLGEKYNASENVLAFIEGSKKPEEVVIISAHHDHEGIEEDGKINNGADDDGSGTVALLEMAQAFKKAQNEGYGPKRSILFLHVTAEEIGLLGSRYYTQNPVFSLENTIANLNIDMIGRVDKYHKENTNYIYLIGADKLSTELHNISETVNTTFFDLELDYKYNAESDHNRYYYRSDHYNFVKKGIPIIFYFNGEHEDYHQPTDTADKINYPLLEKRTRLIFATAWQLANQEKAIIVDQF
ncbi:MAG: peptidase M28 [Bacteroidetes bacterium]|nr:MAG: peptidase M28 [Bacteroidota bacterium]